MIETTLTDVQVLCALYNTSVPSFLRAKDFELTEIQANDYINGTRNEPGQPREGTYFDYLNGTVLKTDVAQRPLDLRLFDRDIGEGAGKRAIRGYEDDLK